MKYKITHTTIYNYTEAVPICHNEVHLTPREHKRQSCLSHRLRIRPEPARIDTRIDAFGNHAGWFSIQEGHERLSVTAHSQVQVAEPDVPAPSTTPPWEEIRDRFALGQPPWWVEARQFVYASPHVPISEQLRAYAQPSFPAGQPWLAGLLDLTRRINQEFHYDPAATTVNTPVAKVLKDRRGVCQDFAHLQIACVRSLGLPARYVSGYLLTTPPPGQPRLVGADASHAWVSAFCPEVGWIDFDPTNNQIPSTRHVTLAWGRDYSDVCPIKGVLVGGGQHRMRVAVDVVPLEA
ncbi:MAG TPA: transglutaminase family protein [Pirellulaceae bacterium]|nr:transglutaminase family protein [Pirellulaceae bacterium]